MKTKFIFPHYTPIRWFDPPIVEQTFSVNQITRRFVLALVHSTLRDQRVIRFEFETKTSDLLERGDRYDDPRLICCLIARSMAVQSRAASAIFSEGPPRFDCTRHQPPPPCKSHKSFIKAIGPRHVWERSSVNDRACQLDISASGTRDLRRMYAEIPRRGIANDGQNRRQTMFEFPLFLFFR